MRSQTAETGARSETRRSRGDPLAEAAPQDRSLFEALRGWRRTEAARQAVPPYVIFHDRTLLEIARARPTTLAELGRTSGVGQGRLDRYGQAILAVLGSSSWSAAAE